MSQNIGTLISAPIRPNDSLDSIPSAYANEILGGIHNYETLTDVYLISTDRRQWGMLATVYNDGNNNGTYQLTYNYYSDFLDENENWKKISLDSISEWQDSVILINVIEPTLEPNVGDRYLLGTSSISTPSGTYWDSYQATIIVQYNNLGSWDLTFPTNGMTVRCDSENNNMYRYQGVFPTGTWNKEKVTQVFYIEPTTSNGVTFSVTTAPTFSQYDKDIIFLAKFGTTNTGTMSLKINGLGEKLIKKQDNGYLLNLLPGELSSNIIYNLSYDGNYFQISNSLSNAQNTQYYIPLDKTVIVAEYEEYWVYGDLTIAGTLINYGKLIVANGSVVLEGSGTLNEQLSGETILVTIKTPTFNTTSTIQMSSTMIVNGLSVSSTIVNNSITTNLLNTLGGVTASYLLSNDGSGSFQWIAPTVGVSDSNLFYNSGGTVSATNSTTGIYRLGNIGIGTASPSTKLHVYATQSGAFRLQDGTQGSGKVLVSDSNGVATWAVDIRPYKVYTALLTRTGATGPSAIVLENTIGTITYSYTSVGVYLIYSSGLFTLGKTVVFIQQEPNGTWGNNLGASRSSINSIVINQSTSSGNNDDDWTYPVSIEIRVYN